MIDWPDTIPTALAVVAVVSFAIAAGPPPPRLTTDRHCAPDLLDPIAA